MSEHVAPRRFRWLRRIVVAAGLVLGGLALLLWYDSRRDLAAWNEACAEADRDDPGWRAADFFGPENYTPPGPTLTGRVRAIFAKLPPKWPDWAGIVRDEDVSALMALNPTTTPPDVEVEAEPPEMDEVRKHRAVAVLEIPPDRPPNRLRSDVERKYWRQAMRDEMVGNARALIGSTPADKLGQSKRPLLANFSIFDFQESRAVTNVLKEHLVLAAEDQQIDEALLDVRAMLAVAQAMDERPMLISFLVETAQQNVAAFAIAKALALGQASPAALNALQADLQRAVQSRIFVKHLGGEQAMIEDFVRSYAEGLFTPQQWKDLTESDAPKVTGWGTADAWIHRIRGGGWRLKHSAEQLRYYQALIQGLRSSPDGLTIQSNRPAEILAAMSAQAAKEIGSVSKLIEADTRRRAILNCAIVAVAAERFRLDSGRWPATPDDLVPKYLAALPTDPFDSKPLRLRRVADGLVIYSIGKDLADDGGDVEQWTKVPDVTQVKDVGLRLYDPAHRRLPAVMP